MYQEAAHRFSIAVKYNPAVVQYYVNRAKAYSKSGKMEEAKEDAIRVLILDPTNEQVRLTSHDHTVTYCTSTTSTTVK